MQPLSLWGNSVFLRERVEQDSRSNWEFQTREKKRFTCAEEEAGAEPIGEVRVLDALGDELVAAEDGLHQFRRRDDDHRPSAGPGPVDGAVLGRPLLMDDA